MATASEKLAQYKQAMAKAKSGSATGARPPVIKGAQPGMQVPISWSKLGWKKPPGIAEIPDKQVGQLLNYARLGYDRAMSLAAAAKDPKKASAWKGVAEMYATAIDFVNALPGGWGPPETQAQLGASVRAFIAPANVTAAALQAGGPSKLTAKTVSKATGVPSTPPPRRPTSPRRPPPAVSDRGGPPAALPVATPVTESSGGGSNTALWIVGGLVAAGIVAALALGGKKSRKAA